MPKIRKNKGGQRLQIMVVALASIIESLVELFSLGTYTWPLRAYFLFEIFED